MCHDKAFVSHVCLSSRSCNFKMFKTFHPKKIRTLSKAGEKSIWKEDL